MQHRELAKGKLVGALATGLKVLRYLAEAKRPVGVSQVARDLKLNGSTCFNILKTLVQEDLIVFYPDDKTYEIGPGLLVLVKGVIESDVLRRSIRPHLEAVAEKHKVTATLFQRIGDNRVILADRAESDSEIRVHMNVGQRMPLLAGAFGRCMAAFSGLTQEDIEKRFKELRWQNPPTIEEYLADIEKARVNGYAIDKDHFVVGVTIVAAPILDAIHKPTMVISAVGFSGQFRGKAVDALAADLRARAKDISELASKQAPHRLHSAG